MCNSYATTKPTLKKKGLYIPFPIPERLYESISMDYISDLPSTKHGNGYVFVVANLLTKMAIVIAYNKSITNEAITKLTFKCVSVYFELP